MTTVCSLIQSACRRLSPHVLLISFFFFFPETNGFSSKKELTLFLFVPIVLSHEMMARGVTHRCAASGGPCAAQGYRATAQAARCTADCPTRVKRAGRPRTRGLKHPRSALVRVHPRRVVVVNVSERGCRWKEHDEAVKMVNFSRDGKHEEETVARKRANRC